MKSKMYTCKWCYKQVIPEIENRHTICRKKIGKQIQTRKRSIDGLAMATDRKRVGSTNRQIMKVIGSQERVPFK